MIHKETLPSGLRVVVEEVPQVHSVAVAVWIGSGSRFETEEIHGVSHFIEHLLFKGTEKRSAREIAESIDGVGGQLNAFTSREQTCVYAKALSDHLPLLVDVIADMLLRSRFETADIDKERQVVIEEINSYQDSPEELVHDLLAQAFWAGHALGFNILGTAQSIRSMTREQILNYYHQRYIPANTVVGIAGRIKVPEAIDLVARHFEAAGGESQAPDSTSPDYLHEIKVTKRSTEQVHLCLGAPGVPFGTSNYYPVQIVNSVLGGGLSSRLFQRIREQLGLAYSVFSYHSAFRDTGMFGLYAGTTPNQAGRVHQLLREEIAGLARDGITSAELARVKEQLTGHLLLGWEDTATRASRLGKSELLTGRTLTLEEILQKIQVVTEDDLSRVTSFLFDRELALAAIGPIERDVFTS
ncbi:MAG: insulinase family protein [Firmicutes bacterium]|nr:insulinase family protein [Bacillota bacterium]